MFEKIVKCSTYFNRLLQFTFLTLVMDYTICFTLEVCNSNQAEFITKDRRVHWGTRDTLSKKLENAARDFFRKFLIVFFTM